MCLEFIITKLGQSRPLYAPCPLLGAECCPSKRGLGQPLIGVHLGFQAPQPAVWIRTRVLLEIPRQLFIGAVIERAALWIAREIKLLPHPPSVLVEVLGAFFIHERVGVGEEQLNIVSIFLLLHLILKPKEERDMRRVKAEMRCGSESGWVPVKGGS